MKLAKAIVLGALAAGVMTVNALGTAAVDIENLSDITIDHIYTSPADARKIKLLDLLSNPIQPGHTKQVSFNVPSAGDACHQQILFSGGNSDKIYFITVNICRDSKISVVFPKD